MLYRPTAKHEGKQPLEDIPLTYRDMFTEDHELFSSWGFGFELPHWQATLSYALVAVALLLIWSAVIGRRRAGAPHPAERWLRLAVVGALIAVGVYNAFAKASCFDDAYISLRYAENFVAGKGLVYNEGQLVEGYTNFLWVLLVSLFMWATPLEAPLIAVVGCLVAMAVNLWVVWRISLKIAPPFHARAFAFPLAVALLAVQNTFTDYGTTGLETAFASLMVNAGVLALISGDTYRHTFGAGLCWIMATLTRPDHALFYIVGSQVVFFTWLRPCWRARAAGLAAVWRAGLRPMAAYAAPFLIWLIYAAWKLYYYGELMPNTYYAKSAYLPYYKQGLVYAWMFHLADHMWLVVVALAVLWPWRPPSNVPGRRFMSFMVPAVILYEWYVIRVGGDFMYGRFYVSLIPLLLLAGEQLVHEFSMPGAVRKRRVAALREARAHATPAATPSDAPDPAPRQRMPLAASAVVIAALMASTAVGFRIIGARTGYWHLTSEASFYPVVRWFPVVIDQSNFRVGQVLGKVHRELGDDVEAPVIAAGAIGFIGYYSQMKVVDRLGLTDPTVAHQEVKKRGRPGHEKWASAAYLRRKGVHFRRGGGYAGWFKRYATIKWGATGGRAWFITQYDRELMAAIRDVDPDIYFHDFEVYIDKYIEALPTKSPDVVKKEWALFKRYYFNHNDDPERREAFVIYFRWVREPGNEPRGLLADHRWDEYKARGAAASRRERELRAKRGARRRRIAQWRLPWLQPQLREEYGLPPRSAKSKKKTKSKSKSKSKSANKPKPTSTNKPKPDSTLALPKPVPTRAQGDTGDTG